MVASGWPDNIDNRIPRFWGSQTGRELFGCLHVDRNSKKASHVEGTLLLSFIATLIILFYTDNKTHVDLCYSALACVDINVTRF